MTPNTEAKPTPAFLISFAAGICSLLTAFLTTQLASLQISFFSSVSTSLTLAAVGSPYSDRLSSDVRASQHQEIRISTGRRFLHHLNELPRIDSRAHRRVPRLGPKL